MGANTKVLPWEPPPLFLSRGAYSRALYLFEAYKTRAPEFERAFVDARTDVLATDWSNFDAVYLALYTLNLGGCKQLPPIKSADRKGRLTKQAGFLFNVDLVAKDHPKRLLDESVLASLVRFKSMFETTVQLETSLNSVGFGCFYMSFSITMPSERILHALYPNLNHRQAAARLLDQHMLGPDWRALKESFGVTYVAID